MRDAALRAAIRPLLVDEGPDLPPAPHEEALLDDVMAAIRSVLDDVEVEWGIRVDMPHPRRNEKAGDIMTHLGEEKSRRCREIWPGWTPVRRRKVIGEWEVADA